RKLLQDEVARTFSARTIARRTAAPSWFAGLRMRLAFTAGFLALLTFASMFWLSKDSGRRAEPLRQSDKVESAERLTSAPQPAGPGAGGQDNRGPGSDQLVLERRSNENEALRLSEQAPQTSRESGPDSRKSETDSRKIFETAENQRVQPAGLPELTLQ